MGYEAVEAFARGLMSALLQHGAEKPAASTPTFVDPADVEQAVRKYIDAELYGGEKPPPEMHDAHAPEPPDWVPPEMRGPMQEVMREMQEVQEPMPFMRRNPEQMEMPTSLHEGEPSGSYDANMPGEMPWSVPRE